MVHGNRKNAIRCEIFNILKAESYALERRKTEALQEAERWNQTAINIAKDIERNKIKMTNMEQRLGRANEDDWKILEYLFHELGEPENQVLGGV